MTTEQIQRLTMRAMVRHEYGDAGRLRLVAVPRPAIGDDDVLVKVHAAGVDRGAWHLMTGLPYPVRLAGYGVRRPRQPVLGREVAGQVVAVGAGVSGVDVGDEVFGIGEGCFAEYVAARADLLVRRPGDLSAVAAAAVPISGLTALQAIRDVARVQAGQRVLVIGASGGVGSFAVQLALAAGADVTGVCGPAKVGMVERLGAHTVIDYSTASIPTDGRFDAIVDAGGHRPLRLLRRALTATGTLVIVGSETGGRWLGGTDRPLRALALSPFVGQRLRPLVSSENGADLAVLADLLERGVVTPVVDRTFPLAGAADAIRYLESGRAMGKIVVTTG
jgi:NADPH:quinone reductase-like Zn-dependent oxidoreductase